MLDLRFLARRKTVAVVAVLTMALALGANTAALSVIKAFLVSGLGVPDADRVLLIAPERHLPGRGAVIFSDAYPNYELLRRTQRAFADVTVLLQLQSSWRDGSEARPLDASRISASFFPTMRVQPVIGRALVATEEGPSPAPVVMISYGLWQSTFGGSPSVLGQTMSLDGRPHTIVGVMPAGFTQPLPTDIWLPFDIPAQQRAAITGGRTLTVYGRIAEGQTLEQARADVERFDKLALAAAPVDNKDYRYITRTLREVLLNNAGATALFVQAGAATLLALAVLNLASLLIAWGFERRQEMTVRLALGAGTRQVTGLLLQQSIVIVGAGALLGIPIAYAGLRMLQQYDFGRTVTLFVGRAQIDVIVLLVTLLIASIAGLTAGALPAWFNRGGDMAGTLRATSRTSTLSPAAVRWQKAMVVGQAGLSTAILVASVLIGLSFWKLMEVPDGFATDGRVVARVVLPDVTYGAHPARARFGQRLVENLAAQPELASSGFVTTLPVSDVPWGGRFFPERPEGIAGQDPLLFHFRRVSPEYFATMDIPMLRGRTFSAADHATSQQVIVVSRALADRMWPGEDALGKRLIRTAVGTAPPTPFTVVGVVGNTMDGGYAAPPGETV
jgi:predicted permease